MNTIKGRIKEVIRPNGIGAITASEHQALLLEVVDDVNKQKQDVIEDLDAIREGAQKGATAAQDIKTINEELGKKVNSSDLATINGQRIDEGGNIEIEGGMSEDEKAELNEKLTELSAEIGTQKPSFVDGYLITSALALQPTNGWRYSEPIRVVKGTRVQVATTGINVSIITQCDKNGTLSTPLIVTSESSFKVYDYDVTEDMYIVICYKYGVEGNGYSIEGLKSQVEKNTEQIQLVNDKVSEIYGATPTFTDGYLITSALTLQATSGWKYSEPVFTKKSTQIKVTTGGKSTAIICKSDASGKLLNALVITPSDASATTLVDYTYLATEDLYIVVCYKYSLEGSGVDFGSLAGKVEDNYKTIQEVAQEVGQNKESIDNLQSEIYGATPTFTNDYLITSALILQPTNGWRYSSPMFLAKGKSVYVKTSGGGVAVIVKSDANGNLLKALSVSPKPNNYLRTFQYTATEDMYVVVCYKYSIEGSCYSIGGIKDLEFDTPKKKLKVLVLGNSYAADAWTYVPIILKNYGIDIEIKMYYRGALALSQLYERWTSKEYQDTEEGYLPGLYTRFLYYCDTEDALCWQSLERQSAAECVAEGGWDVISMQQMSVASLYEESYEPYAREIIKLIAEGMQTPYTLAFSQIFTRPSHDNIEASMTEQGKFWKKEPFNMLLPYGTSIYNARTNAELADLGNSASKNLWCSDEVHIQEGLPKYIAALTIVQSLFNRYYNGMSVLNDSTRITDALLDSWRMVERRDNAVGITEENCILAQKCAILAVNHPWEILPIL